MSATFRLSVLRLAAAHPEDRAWVLGQLPPPQKRHVASALAEVRAFGIEDFSPWITELEARLGNDANTPSSVAGRHADWAAWLLDDAQAGHSILTLDQQLRLDDMADASRESGSSRNDTENTVAAMPPALRAHLHSLLLNGATAR